MAILKQSTNYVRAFPLFQSASPYLGLTGATPTVNISKAGASLAAAAGTVAEIGNGYYKITLHVNDVDTIGDLAFYITAASANPTYFVDQVQTKVFADLQLNAGGFVLGANNIKQNTALNGFTFVMTSDDTHAPATGLTVTAQRSLAGAGFSPCANSVSEVSNGIYTINLAAADVNAATVMLRFTATDADDLNIFLITQP